MKQLIFLLSIIVIFACNEGHAGPKLEIVGGDTYDWKDVYPSENPLKAKLLLKNTGDETLYISEVKPGCSCTTAPLEKNSLKPGEEIYMDVELKIRDTDKKMNKNIKVVSNDTEDPVRYVNLKANVILPLEIEPQRFFAFTNLKVGKESESIITLKNITEKEIKLYDFKVSPEKTGFNIDKDIKIKPGEQIELKVTVKPDSKGPVSCSVEFKTSHAALPTIKFFGSGRAVN